MMDLIYNPETKKWGPPISETIFFPTEEARQVFVDDLLCGNFRSVTHAHWRPADEPPFLVCSNCGNATCVKHTKTPYCHECGAKMDEDTMTAY